MVAFSPLEFLSQGKLGFANLVCTDNSIDFSAYNYTDPGLLFDIHNTRGPKYVVPGPKVWTGSKGGRIGHAAAEQSVHSHANSLVFGGGLPVGSWSDDGGFYGGAFLADPMPYHDDDFLDTPFHDFDFNETDTHDINFHDTTYHDTAYHDAAYHDTAYHDTDFHDAAFHDAEFHSSHNVASAKAPHASADSNHDLVPEHGQCGGHYWKVRQSVERSMSRQYNII